MNKSLINKDLNCPICSTLEEALANEILNYLQKRSFKKDAIVLESDEASPGLFLVLDGRVKVSRLSPQGKELVLDILKEGQCFGERSALEATTQGDLVTAVSDATLYLLPREKLLELLAKHPSLYPSVLKSICNWTSHLNNVIDSIGIASARERVAAFIKRLAADQSSELVSLPHKKHEVAMMLGLRPETFSRALGEIEMDGAIKLNHRQIQIVKANLL
jgi:CRP/FNR family transcriptional regulator